MPVGQCVLGEIRCFLVSQVPVEDDSAAMLRVDTVSRRYEFCRLADVPAGAGDGIRHLVGPVSLALGIGVRGDLNEPGPCCLEINDGLLQIGSVAAVVGGGSRGAG